MRRSIVSCGALLACIALSACGGSPADAPSVSSSSSSGAPDAAASSSVAGYTLDQVSAHASKADCYTAVNGNVYDLTPFIASHPGGEDAIAYLCGKDGTEAFTRKHGGKEKPESMLASLQIGVLK